MARGRGTGVTFDDQGWDEIKQRVESLKGRSVRVGILSSQQHESGSGDVLEIAIANEFGTEHIPERSFIRAPYDQNQQVLSQRKGQLIRGVERGKLDAERALAILGELHVDQIQTYMERLRDPSNAESTEEQKGSSNPLIDTGHTRRSVNYEVE